MRLALLSLALITVHVSVMVDCGPLHWRPISSLKTAAGAHMSAGVGPFSSEQNGPVGKRVHRGLLVFFPLRMTTKGYVSIFDLRNKQLLCVDINGELYKSRRKDRWDCPFQHIWIKLGTRQNEFYSMSGTRKIRLGGGGLRVAHRGPLERFQHPSVKRQRRSEEVNPADPLQTESHPSNPPKHVNLGQPEQEQVGAISKETISSCDDPLQVLQPNGHSSPVKTNIADRAEHQ